VRILFLSQYFTPELTAGAARVHAFATALAARGHQVDVVCEVPNHPRGIIEAGYGGRLVDTRELDGFVAHYVRVPVSVEKSTAKRLANYGGYAAMASIAGSLRRRIDVVFASSPPLPVGAAGALVAARHRAPWALDVRDLWPDAAVAVGELRGGRAIRAAEALERRLYASASAIVAPSAGSLEQIAQRTGDRSKLHFLPSGTTADWLRIGGEAPVRGLLPVPDGAFVWTYAGNLGLAQGLDSAIDAAAALGPDFHLLLVGDGPLRAELADRAERAAPGQVTFTGLLPREEAGRLMRASDALLVSLSAAPGIEYAVPSKLYDCCAVGRPIVVAAAGEARRLALDEAVALAAEPESPESIADAVRTLRDEPRTASALAESARAFAERNLRETQAGRLESILAGLVAARR
jgi:glycosyltransferase involved in cell wall biosynthesis